MLLLFFVLFSLFSGLDCILFLLLLFLLLLLFVCFLVLCLLLLLLMLLLLLLLCVCVWGVSVIIALIGAVVLFLLFTEQRKQIFSGLT